jgi:hypothetical protein
MPLHRLWDTVDAQPGMFDTVIVDEASQAGIDSLVLLLLAKRVVVVGDDKQNSPVVRKNSAYRIYGVLACTSPRDDALLERALMLIRSPSRARKGSNLMLGVSSPASQSADQTAPAVALRTLMRQVMPGSRETFGVAL